MGHLLTMLVEYRYCIRMTLLDQLSFEVRLISYNVLHLNTSKLIFNFTLNKFTFRPDL